MLADDCIKKILDTYEFTSVWNIGSGEGEQTEAFRAQKKTVVEFDKYKQADFSASCPEDFTQENIDEWCRQTNTEPEVVFASHVLEHSFVPNEFLRALQRCADKSGEQALLAITVPPAKPSIVGGHITLWNAGLLLYNMILAGIDCSEAHVKTYGYNISVITKNKRVPEEVLADCTFSRGDIERLSPYFPFRASQNFHGCIESINW